MIFSMLAGKSKCCQK